MSATDASLANNRDFAAGFELSGMAAPPARSLAILTCMDARLHPERFLGLQIGDAHVIRNAGGRASDDAVHSLIISSQLLGTREFLVIHHTDCGMLMLSNSDVHERLTAATGADASHIDFLPFDDLEEGVREDVRRIRQSPFIPAEASITGHVYNVDTGLVTPVAGAAG